MSQAKSPPPHRACDGALFIGLMSGTSLDGTDGVLARFAPVRPTSSKAVLGRGQPPQVEILARAHRDFPEDLRRELFALNSRGGTDELHRAALAGNAIAFSYADVVQALLNQTGMAAQDVAAIGAHGQTLRHQPQMHDGVGYTLQILNAALLAERTGIDVVADLRVRDVAAGGQGAPLVPAFHDFVFGQNNHNKNYQENTPTFILNIGGISNISILLDNKKTIGFDCGPGNALMDFWCHKNTGQHFDNHGQWAASGHIIAELLQALWDEPFFQQNPPKSTGRDLFNPQWLQSKMHKVGLGHVFENPPSHSHIARDIQATLTELTARACAQSVLDFLKNHPHHHKNTPAALFVCGGGAFNDDLLARLQNWLWPHVQVGTTAEVGLGPLDVEAAAFAWLAREFLASRAGNVPAVTGSRGPRILGALHRA